MTQWVDALKDGLPEYAKDTKLNLDAVIKRSTLPVEEAEGCALAAAMSTGNGKLISYIMSNIADEKERDAAMTAGSLMPPDSLRRRH